MKKLLRRLRTRRAGITVIVFGIFSLVGMFFNLWYGLSGLVLCFLLMILLGQREAEHQKRVHQLAKSIVTQSGEEKTPITEMPMPSLLAMATTGEIVWANQSFIDEISALDLSAHKRINEIAPTFETRWLIEGQHRFPGELNIGRNAYHVFGSLQQSGGGQLMLLHFVECTEYVHLRDEASTTRPAIMLITIDNYEELTKNATDAEKSEIMAAIDKRLSAWTRESGGVMRRFDRDKYLFILELLQLEKLAARKFTILQEVREVQNREGVIATLSIGAGRDGQTLAESHSFAGLAVDMALSRGGDQAVIKNRFAFEFFGGLSEEVERRTKVKSRVVANALGQLIRGASQVLVMGHRNSDMDAIGAAAGIVCVARNKNAKVHIVVDRQKTLAGELIDYLAAQPEYQEVFISPEDAMVCCDSDTLLVVVDVNRPGYAESEALLETIHKVAVIDHHRRAADYIKDAVVSLHEPYASSSCELSCEILQYTVPTTGILKAEAEALLAGIYLDTKGFSNRTGVRTFEAAAYLKRVGADAAEVRRLFQSSFDLYMERQKLVAAARECGEGVILAVTDREISRVAAAQAADDLLGIIGTRASVVAYRSGEDMLVSARGAGHVNVQYLMEKLGGGGNHSAAGAQLKSIKPKDADKKITAVIRSYLKEVDVEEQFHEKSAEKAVQTDIKGEVVV